jgi:hypothetical protein
MWQRRRERVVTPVWTIGPLAQASRFVPLQPPPLVEPVLRLGNRTVLAPFASKPAPLLPPSPLLYNLARVYIPPLTVHQIPEPFNGGKLPSPVALASVPSGRQAPWMLRRQWLRPIAVTPGAEEP